nr:MAG TPA: hypothetical protein [Caudoviricetes sp.]
MNRIEKRGLFAPLSFFIRLLSDLSKTKIKSLKFFLTQLIV